jgi:hypothetical protein
MTIVDFYFKPLTRKATVGILFHFFYVDVHKISHVILVISVQVFINGTLKKML